MPENILVTLSLGILITSLAGVEFRNLRSSVWAYFFHSIFLCSIIVAYATIKHNPSLYIWGVTCFITKVIIIPVLLFRYVRRVPPVEYQPILGFSISLVLVAAFMLAFYRLFKFSITFLAPTEAATTEPTRSLLALAFTVFSVGIYALLTRRDAIKTVIGLALLENGVHLVLLALVPNLAETTMIGILTNVIAVVIILLYISTTIYEVFGTTDTVRLSELKR